MQYKIMNPNFIVHCSIDLRGQFNIIILTNCIKWQVIFIFAFNSFKTTNYLYNLSTTLYNGGSIRKRYIPTLYTEYALTNVRTLLCHQWLTLCLWNSLNNLTRSLFLTQIIIIGVVQLHTILNKHCR